jgi:hypothetical protein
VKIFASLGLAMLLVSSVARADIQTKGPEEWPGKIMFSARPLGVQVNFNSVEGAGIGTTFTDAFASYKLGLDVAGIIASLPKLTIWLGGELNIGGRAYLAILEPGFFVQLTLEKLLTIPLVPIIKAGISGPLYALYGFPGASAGGAFQIKVGGGVYYFLTKHIGVGAETAFAFGPGFVHTVGGGTGIGFSGYWDFTMGARFAF